MLHDSHEDSLPHPTARRPPLPNKTFPRSLERLVAWICGDRDLDVALGGECPLENFETYGRLMPSCIMFQTERYGSGGDGRRALLLLRSSGR